MKGHTLRMENLRTMDEGLRCMRADMAVSVLQTHNFADGFYRIEDARGKAAIDVFVDQVKELGRVVRHLDNTDETTVRKNKIVSSLVTEWITPAASEVAKTYERGGPDLGSEAITLYASACVVGSLSMASVLRGNALDQQAQSLQKRVREMMQQVLCQAVIPHAESDDIIAKYTSIQRDNCVVCAQAESVLHFFDLCASEGASLRLQGAFFAVIQSMMCDPISTELYSTNGAYCYNRCQR